MPLRMSRDAAQRSLTLRPHEPGLVRVFELARSPGEVLDTVLEHGRIVERHVTEDDAFAAPVHDGATFAEPTAEGLRLWRRPTRALDRGRAPALYPDVLDLRLEPSVVGTRVHARWQRHPLAAVAELRLGLAGSLALAVGAVLMTTSSPAYAPASLLVAAAAGARIIAARRARRELLDTAYEALAPIEAGATDRPPGYRAIRSCTR